jgi:hypothetical protein
VSRWWQRWWQRGGYPSGTTRVSDLRLPETGVKRAADLPVLRAGRQDLHQRLAAEVDRIAADLPRNRDVYVWALLQEARDAVLTCPHTGCAYCFTVDREETP